MSETEFQWNYHSRHLWRTMDKARIRKNVHLALAWGPYVISAGMLALGGAGRDADSRALMAVGGLLFLLFVFIAPYWLFITLYEWKRARDTYRGSRKSFRDFYRVDPVDISPPDD